MAKLFILEIVWIKYILEPLKKGYGYIINGFLLGMDSCLRRDDVVEKVFSNEMKDLR